MNTEKQIIAAAPRCGQDVRNYVEQLLAEAKRQHGAVGKKQQRFTIWKTIRH